MMRVLLVDDEPLALDRLKVGFNAIEDVEVAGTASDGVEAVEKIRALEPDLIILDIQMPGRSGMEIARALRPEGHRPEIIFVTAFDRFATDAFEVEAADYLLKPVAFDRLRLGVERARRRRALRDAEGQVAELGATLAALRNDARAAPAPAVESPYDQGIWVPGRQGAVLVPVSMIDWIEAARDYVLLNTPLKSHILRARMNDIEQRLDPALMLRIHRSHIVRIGAVVGVERPGKGALRVVLSDDAVLQVGPNYQATVEAVLKLQDGSAFGEGPVARSPGLVANATAPIAKEKDAVARGPTGLGRDERRRVGDRPCRSPGSGRLPPPRCSPWPMLRRATISRRSSPPSGALPPMPRHWGSPLPSARMSRPTGC